MSKLLAICFLFGVIFLSPNSRISAKNYSVFSNLVGFENLKGLNFDTLPDNLVKEEKKSASRSKKWRDYTFKY